MVPLTVLVTPQRAGLKAEGSTTFHLLVQVQGPPAPEGLPGRRPPLNLALVLDRSGSMGGRPLQEAKRAAEAILDRLLPQDRLALVAYDGTAKVLVPGRAVEDPEAFRLPLRAILPGGNTNLHGGWDAGRQEVMAGLVPGQVARVLLLSDGEANAGLQDPAAQGRAAAEAAGQGVGTSTYGLGASFNEALMVDLARQGQGRTYYGETAEDLLAPFLEEFHFMAARCASEVTVAVLPRQRVQVTQLTNHLPSGTRAWRLPELAWASEVWLFLEVTVPASFTGGTVLDVLVSWQDGDGQRQALDPMALALPALDEEAYGALAEAPLVRARFHELEVALWEQRAYDAAMAGDGVAVQFALDALKALGKDDAWTRDRSAELASLAGDRARLTKELFMGYTTGGGSHTRDLDQPGRTASEAPDYLRRKKRQGKGGDPAV